jgi:hypothetical protein
MADAQRKMSSKRHDRANPVDCNGDERTSENRQARPSRHASRGNAWIVSADLGRRAARIGAKPQ